MDRLTRPRPLVVLPNEMTCTACGETFPAGEYCPRCSLDEDGKRRMTRPRAVRTIDYLREGEYELAK